MNPEAREDPKPAGPATHKLCHTAPTTHPRTNPRTASPKDYSPTPEPTATPAPTRPHRAMMLREMEMFWDSTMMSAEERKGPPGQGRRSVWAQASEGACRGRGRRRVGAGRRCRGWGACGQAARAQGAGSEICNSLGAPTQSRGGNGAGTGCTSWGLTGGGRANCRVWRPLTNGKHRVHRQGVQEQARRPGASGGLGACSPVGWVVGGKGGGEGGAWGRVVRCEGMREWGE